MICDELLDILKPRDDALFTRRSFDPFLLLDLNAELSKKSIIVICEITGHSSPPASSAPDMRHLQPFSFPTRPKRSLTAKRPVLA